MKISFYLVKLAFGILFVLGSQTLLASDLNWGFLQGDASVNKSAFNDMSSRYIPGRYLVDVELNGTAMGKRVLTVTGQDKDSLCVDEIWLKDANIHVSSEFYALEYDLARQCYQVEQEKDSNVEFDFSTQTLRFGIPQRGLVKNDVNYEWDYGTSALRADYSANVSVNDVNTNLYSSIGLLANIGRWVGSSSMSVTQQSIDMPMVTATRALYDWKADLIVGKTSTGNSLVGGASMLGIGLTSNSNMLPNKVGYTPVFSGIANSDSRVTLSQNGSTVYSEMVPPGPFDIRNISLLGSGDITMTITETDGRQQVSFFPLTIVPNMLSPDDWEYGLYAGLRDRGLGDLDGAFMSGNLGYGFDGFTLKSSVLMHAKYLGLGGAFVTGLGEWGTVGVEGSYSHAMYDDGVTHSGGKAVVTYTKKINNNTDLQLVGAQNTSKLYTEFSGFAPAVIRDRDENNKAQKSQYNISLTHRFSNTFNGSVSAWQRKYWGGGVTSAVNGNVSANFDFFNVNLGIKTSQTDTVTDYGMSLSLSVPFSAFNRNVSTYALMNQNRNGPATYQSGVSSSLNDRVDYTADVSKTDGSGQPTYNLRSNYKGDLTQVSGRMSKSGGSVTGSASMRGAMIALPTKDDVIFTGNISDTIVIANVGEEGVKFVSSPYPSNNKGNAVIPVSAYQVNNITLLGDTLPVDVELSDTNKKLVPTNRAVVYMPFESIKVKRYLFQIKNQQGNYVPTGSWATTTDGLPLGFISQHGVLFVNSVDELKGFIVDNCNVAASAIKEITELQEVHCE
ncbi:fimbria/pilus outer membrane usher protein [Shewanella frigidimarina]|uniref:fimbria/pilus outer membrane usher protein n=1 Tax=Shewanella frigidimarina TaxID=56812 RepID=UPI00318080B8